MKWLTSEMITCKLSLLSVTPALSPLSLFYSTLMFCYFQELLQSLCFITRTLDATTYLLATALVI